MEVDLDGEDGDDTDSDHDIQDPGRNYNTHDGALTSAKAEYKFRNTFPSSWELSPPASSHYW